MSERTPIVLAFTANYFVPVCTCLFSVLSNSEEEDHYHVVCLLTDELPETMQLALQNLGGERCTFSFINLKGRLSADIYVDEKYTIAASYRLLLPDLLPEYDKVLYVDCDMIFRNNVAQLYRDTDLNDFYMAGVFEATLDFQLVHMEKIGCAPGSYINSGLLLMNLDLLRKDNMVQRFLQAATEDGLEFPDQDVINQLCAGRIVGLPPYWNSIRTFFLPQYKSNFLQFYTEEDWNYIQYRGNIHYTGPKPWNTFTVKFDVWWTYFERLPQALKAYGRFDQKVYLFAKFYRTVLGKKLIDIAQRSYRALKSERG